MATIQEILEKCTVDELRDAAGRNGLANTGRKAELVSRLSSGQVRPRNILRELSSTQLQSLLKAYSKPKSGKKAEVVDRVLSIVERPKRGVTQQAEAAVGEAVATETKETSYQKGHDFEREVGKWAARKLKGEYLERTKMARGIRMRIHDVDVHVRILKRYLLVTEQHDVWIECKSFRQSVKFRDIRKLVTDAQDVYVTWRQGRGEDYYFDGLMFVSKSKFDPDALYIADRFDVWCFQHEEGKYVPQNNPDDWLGDPAWMKEVK